ncbi:N,N-dimethylformamidase beta subunit family domain-containing protein [Rhodococcus erythropolis]|uniref:N,N-dimethylformamidase beta subunit family domain-containing protein n=1 Tax=Rhodococcus erythropolis TaxID=1833 RepID=UPI00040549E9|nr:N,N-dimethylformamidase beta subunit family domain-containing protein [Rhodococcus erythropolis]
MREKTRPRRAGAAAAWSATGGLVERPGMIPGAPEIWVYADKFSYFAGDTVSVRVHTTADEYDIEVVRDGARPQSIVKYIGLPGKQQSTPDDAYATGCDWSESVAFTVAPNWASGMLRKPEGAARNIHTDMPGIGWVPRHPPCEWAWVNGYSRHHADAFWATYERPFTVWAEEQAFLVHHITQHDLHEDPSALRGYSCAVVVGHDEYWSWEMRDRLDAFVEGGGGLARFGGNFLWQVRIEGDAQICYKNPFDDPIREVDPTRVTTAWDSPEIDRPGAWTMGLTAMAGVYNRYGATAPRSSGGFTVYRPDHWALNGTDLYYGDNFGIAPVCIAAFAMDGADYTFRKGLPYATGVDGAPEDLEIIAMAPAVSGSRDNWNGTAPIGAPLAEVSGIFESAYGRELPEHLREFEYGSGMVATHQRGLGTVFNAGTTEWVSGLIHRDPFTERITANVLNLFAAQLSSFTEEPD